MGGKKRQDLALRILFDNSYVLVNEQEESQVVEALESMASLALKVRSKQD